SAISRASVAVLYFFFQAEDGIRAPLVTGVQTCALPIYRRRHLAECRWHGVSDDHGCRSGRAVARGVARGECHGGRTRREQRRSRSEERRVGKGGRSGGFGGE